MDGKQCRSTQDFALSPSPQATYLLGLNFEFHGSVVRLGEKPSLTLLFPPSTYYTAHESRFLGKSFLDADEERITWESVCQQLVCTSLLVS